MPVNSPLNKRIIIFLLLLVSGPALSAGDNSSYDRITLSVEAVAEAANDTLVAVLYAQREGADIAALSDAVNKSISRAVQQSKKQHAINVQTLGYQTHPVYQSQRQSGWRVRQSVQLKSEDMTALSQLVGELQNNLALQSISYMVSPAQRVQVEDRLISEAIADFKARAKLISQQLDRTDYRLVSMDIRTNGSRGHPVPIRGMATMEAKVAAPVVEPGTQTITVTVSGVIELAVN